MNKLLILLTSVYPTSSGDMFVHEELKYLVRDFSRILLFPVNATGQAGPRVSPPEEVKVHLSNRRGKVAGYLRDIRFALQRRNWQSKDIAYDRRNRVKNLKQILYLAFAESRARQVLADSKAIIDKELSQANYDEIVVYSYWMSIPARAALLIKEDLIKRYPNLAVHSYARGHGYDIYDEASAAGFQPFRRALIERMDALFPCSAYGVQYMKRRFVQAGEQAPIYLSRLGIEDPLVKRNLDAEEVLTRRQGKEGVLRLVSCSRVLALKRLPLLIDALVLLRDSGLDLHWVHFGDGQDFEELMNLCKSKLDFMSWELRGHVENKLILDYYCQEEIDLFVSVSSTEGVPVSMMEAMAAAIPVASTDVGGVAEIVLEDRGGKLWPAEVSPAEIAASLRRKASQEPLKRQAEARQAREVWGELCDASLNYTQMSQIVSGMLRPTDVPMSADTELN